MEQKIYVKKWNYEGDKVQLEYHDGSTLLVRKKDFNQAFGSIVNASKQEVERDYAIKDHSTESADITAKELMEYLSYLAAIACTNTSTPVGSITFNSDQIRSAYIDILKNRESYQTYRSIMFDKNGVRHEPS